MGLLKKASKVGKSIGHGIKKGAHYADKGAKQSDK